MQLPAIAEADQLAGFGSTDGHVLELKTAQEVGKTVQVLCIRLRNWWQVTLQVNRLALIL